jgi:hypothetical protein
MIVSLFAELFKISVHLGLAFGVLVVFIVGFDKFISAVAWTLVCFIKIIHRLVG